MIRSQLEDEISPDDFNVARMHSGAQLTVVRIRSEEDTSELWAFVKDKNLLCNQSNRHVIEMVKF